MQEDPHRYRVCRFDNACVNSTHTLLVFPSEEERAQVQEILKGCRKQGVSFHVACQCLSSGRAYQTVDPSAVSSLKKVAGNYWLFDKYVPGKHFGHWAEALSIFHSIFLHNKAYGLSPLSGFVLLQEKPPLTNHEENFMNIALAGLESYTERIWSTDLNEGGGKCFQAGFSSTITGRIATHSQDGSLFRMRAYDHFGFQVQDCPPPKTLLLHRSGSTRQRKILNEDELEQTLRKLGIQDIERVTVSDQTNSLSQALLFHSAGLVISPHGSELLNMVFSHPNTAFIEVVPTILNFDFAQIGLDLGTPLWFSVGGTVPGIQEPGVVSNCNKIFKNCVGEPRCCRQKEKENLSCQKSQKGPGTFADYVKEVKHQDFYADAKAFERVVSEMLKKLKTNCHGNWTGSI